MIHKITQAEFEAMYPNEEHGDHCAWLDGDEGCNCGLFDAKDEIIVTVLP